MQSALIPRLVRLAWWAVAGAAVTACPLPSADEKEFTCSSDAWCAEGWACVEGVCRQACGDSSGCAPGHECRAGACVPGAAGGSSGIAGGSGSSGGASSSGASGASSSMTASSSAASLTPSSSSGSSTSVAASSASSTSASSSTAGSAASSGGSSSTSLPASSSASSSSGSGGVMDGGTGDGGGGDGGGVQGSLAYETPGHQVPAGSCSPAVTVGLRNAAGMPVTASTAVMIDVAASPGGVAVFTDAQCTQQVAGPSVGAGSTRVTFHFLTPRARTLDLAVSAPGYAPATQTHGVTPLAPFALAFATAPRVIVTGACSARIRVEVQDRFGNRTSLSTPEQLGVAASGPPDFSVRADSGCTTLLSSPVALAAGDSEVAFHATGVTAGDGTVTVSSSTLGQAVQVQRVVAGAPVSMAWLTAPQVLAAGTCSEPLEFELRDAMGNPAIAVTDMVFTPSSSDPEAEYFRGADACTGTAGAPVVVMAGQDRGSLRLRTPRAGMPVTTLATPGITGTVMRTDTVDAGAPFQLVFEPPAPALEAGVCLQGVRVRLQDRFGNTVNAAGDIAGTMVSTPGGALQFGAACAGEDAAFTIAAGTPEVLVDVRALTAGTYMVSAVPSPGSPLVAATGTFTVAPGAPAAVRISSAAQQVTAGSCSQPVDLELVDAWGNPAAARTATTVQLVHDGGPSFGTFDDDDCMSPGATALVAAGETTTRAFFMGTRVGAVMLSASLATEAPATQAQRILADLPHHLLAQPARQSLLVGDCGEPTSVTVVDAYDNPATDTGPRVITLSANAAFNGFTFHAGADTACATALAPATLTVPGGQSTASFRVRSPRTGQVEMTATASPLLPEGMTADIIPNVRTGTCTIANGTSVTTCATGAVGDRARAVLLFGARTNNPGPGGSNVRCRFTSAGDVVCDRSGTPGDAAISFQVVEPPHAWGVRVEHVDHACTNTTADLAIPIQPVDPARTFLVHSFQQQGNDVNGDDFHTVTLTGASSVAISMAAGTGCLLGGFTTVQVVEWPGAAVTRGETLIPAGTAAVSVTQLSPVNRSRSVLLYSWRMPEGSVNLCSRGIRGTLPDGTSVGLARGDGAVGCPLAQVDAVSWERVQFPAGASVLALDVALTSAETLRSVALSGSVDLDRTVALTGGQWTAGQGWGEGGYQADDILGAFAASTTLTGAQALTVERGAAGGTARYNVFILTLGP